MNFQYYKDKYNEGTLVYAKQDIFKFDIKKGQQFEVYFRGIYSDCEPDADTCLCPHNTDILYISIKVDSSRFGSFSLSDFEKRFSTIKDLRLKKLNKLFSI